MISTQTLSSINISIERINIKPGVKRLTEDWKIEPEQDIEAWVGEEAIAEFIQHLEDERKEQPNGKDAI